MPHKAGRTTGCNLFPLLRSLVARASGKTCYALPAAQPCTFCPLLAEADLLTGERRALQTLNQVKHLL
jgi:hypothetical protein